MVDRLARASFLQHLTGCVFASSRQALKTRASNATGVAHLPFPERPGTRFLRKTRPVVSGLNREKNTTPTTTLFATSPT